MAIEIVDVPLILDQSPWKTQWLSAKSLNQFKGNVTRNPDVLILWWWNPIKSLISSGKITLCDHQTMWFDHFCWIFIYIYIYVYTYIYTLTSHKAQLWLAHLSVTLKPARLRCSYRSSSRHLLAASHVPADSRTPGNGYGIYGTVYWKLSMGSIGSMRHFYGYGICFFSRELLHHFFAAR